MAPLVPEILSPEFSFVIAFIVGVGFGFALEQAGFSSSRKLVGLFYGYDFTVLKVFFTAGVTAMTGVLVLSHLGLLDMNVIYINPTFIWAAIVGGAIMGVGFILGGFCPGTSLCALAVGRLDALAFVGGSLLGILLFAETYAWTEPLFLAGNMGTPTMDSLLGISAELFGLLLTIVAIAAFWFTSKIEDKVSGKKVTIPRRKKITYAATAALPILIILAVWSTPDRKEAIFNRVETVPVAETGEMFEVLSIEKMAFEMMNHIHEYNIVDVRDTTAFNEESLPGAINIPYPDLYNREWRKMLTQPYKTNVFIGSDEQGVYRAALLASELGDTDPVYLDASVEEFMDTVFSPVEPAEDAGKTELTQYRFYMQASQRLREIEERIKNSIQPPKTIIKKVEGGCS